jgi:imidazolonepropionase
MPLLKNISTLYVCPDDGDQSDVHPVHDAVISWKDGIIEWVGPKSEFPGREDDYDVLNAGGRIVIPGLVDCHTHLAFGGWRPDEFEMRVQGKSYLEISRSGGGILSTVRETRSIHENELYEKTAGLLDKINRSGTTTIECKSGYGLSLKDEIKTLRVYDRLRYNKTAHIISTFLGAHTIPPEFQDNRKSYISLLTDDIIPRVGEEKLAKFCDVFVEESAFTVDEARHILEAGKRYGLQPKVHADQLTSCGGAELAAETGAISADHLEKVSDLGIKKMADAGVIAVTLPFASLYTQESFLDCRKLMDGGVRVAVATDFNPGSAPCYDMPLAMMLACNQSRLTPAQALKGATIYGAKAIGMENSTGSLEKGKSADFLVIDAPSVNFWMYQFAPDRKMEVFLKGECIQS